MVDFRELGPDESVSQDPLEQLTALRRDVSELLHSEMGETKGFKFGQTLEINFERESGPGKTTYRKAYVSGGKATSIVNPGEIDAALDKSTDVIMAIIASWARE